MRIMIEDIVKSDTAISYIDGQKCLQEILKYIDREKEIILDFRNINFVITAFLNPVIGDLILQKGQQIMSKIKIENVNKSILDKIKVVRDGTLLKQEDMNEH